MAVVLKPNHLTLKVSHPICCRLGLQQLPIGSLGVQVINQGKVEEFNQEKVEEFLTQKGKLEG